MTFAVGDKVRCVHPNQRWTGTVIEVGRRTGGIWIEWSCWPQPFFRGPYRPEEIEAVVQDTERPDEQRGGKR